MALESRLRNVFAAVLGVDPEGLSKDDSPQTIADWDSVNHIHLILALESEFGVAFDPGEIGDLVTVGAIADRLAGASNTDG